MPESEKQKYTAEAAKAKEQYEKNLEEWEKKMIKEGHLDVVRQKTLDEAFSKKQDGPCPDRKKSHVGKTKPDPTRSVGQGTPSDTRPGHLRPGENIVWKEVKREKSTTVKQAHVADPEEKNGQYLECLTSLSENRILVDEREFVCQPAVKVENDCIGKNSVKCEPEDLPKKDVCLPPVAEEKQDTLGSSGRKKLFVTMTIAVIFGSVYFSLPFYIN